MSLCPQLLLNHLAPVLGLLVRSPESQALIFAPRDHLVVQRTIAAFSPLEVKDDIPAKKLIIQDIQSLHSIGWHLMNNFSDFYTTFLCCNFSLIFQLGSSGNSRVLCKHCTGRTKDKTGGEKRKAVRLSQIVSPHFLG